MKKLTEDRIYYKCVSNDLTSAYAHFSDASVQYKQCEWVYPHIPYSKLFVFNTFETARNFSRGLIYTCKVYNPQIMLKMVLPGHFSDENIINFWRRKKRKKPYDCFTGVVYQGTVICDAIMLLEKIPKKIFYP